MLGLTIFDYFREIKNIFISLFIAGLCLLIAILYSFLDYENGKIKPFRSLSDKKGFVTYFIQEQDETSDNYMNKRNIEDYPGIEKEYISYKMYLQIGNKQLETYAYEELIWNNWHGRLKEGRWFKKSDINNSIIPVIIGGDTNNYQVGDTFTIDSNGTKAEVIGLMQKSTEIFDLDTYDFYHFDYSGFYKAPNEKEGVAYVICQYEALENTSVISSVNYNWGIYVFDDSLTKEEADKLNTDLYFSSNSAGKDLETFIKESEILSKQKIYTYIPTIVVSILIMIAAIYCVSYVKIQNSGKIYSVYYLNGASKAKIYEIVIGYVFITIFFSALFYVIGGIWFDSFARQHNIMYSFWGNSLVIPLILYLVFGTIMSVCLIAEIKNKSAVELLKSRAM